MNLRHALRRDLPAISGLWVEAFSGDPYLRWIDPSDQEWSAFGGAWMTFIVELAFERGHTYFNDSTDVAVAWIPPDLSLVGPDDPGHADAVVGTRGRARPRPLGGFR